MTGIPRLALGTLLVVAGCVIGIVATTLANPSPREAAEARQVPSLPPATAVVKKQALAQYVQGTCEPSAVDLSVLPPALPSGRRAVVTSIDATAGTPLRPGARLLSVSGEPMVAFVSALPFYRDLRQGDTGPDVKALEDGLMAAGLISSADSTLGADTASVLARLNAEAGLSVRGIDLGHSVAVPANSAVAGVRVSVGQVIAADAAVLTIGAATQQATCLVPTSVPVSVGAEVSLTAAGEQLKATVAGVTASKDNPGQSEITVRAEAPIPAGAQIQLLDGAATPESLSVPAGAIAISASGKPQVRKLAAGASTDIDIAIGRSAGGWVQVTGEGLAEGDAVQLWAAS